LGEIPTQAQYIGGSLVLVGIFLSQIKTKRQINQFVSQISVTQIKQKIEAEMGFNGF
jgi:hypothetical protein